MPPWGGLLQLVEYHDRIPEFLIFYLNTKTFGRIYNTFNVLDNPRDDAYKELLLVPYSSIFYDDTSIRYCC